MTYTRGEVVLARVGYSNGSGGKVRPALVVHDHAQRAGQTDHILVMITSNLTRATGCAVRVVPGSAAFAAMGLLQESLVVADKIVIVEDRYVHKRIGTCPLMLDVDAMLRRALGL